MAVAATVDKNHDLGDLVMARGTLALSGSYVGGGEDMSSAWTGLIPGSTKKPVDMTVHGEAGYVYEYDFANDKLLVREQTDPADTGGANIPLVELAAAAYPAGVSGDTIRFVAYFEKFA